MSSKVVDECWMLTPTSELNSVLDVEGNADDDAGCFCEEGDYQGKLDIGTCLKTCP
jgi:hypothetical protein